MNIVDYSKRLSPLLAKLLMIAEVLPKEALSSPTASTPSLPSSTLTEHVPQQEIIIEPKKIVANLPEKNPFDDDFLLDLAPMTISNNQTPKNDAFAEFFGENQPTTIQTQQQPQQDPFGDLMGLATQMKSPTNTGAQQPRQQNFFDDDPF
jgi:hypothetical protein